MSQLDGKRFANAVAPHHIQKMEKPATNWTMTVLYLVPIVGLPILAAVGAFALAVGRASGFVMEGDADQATTWRRIAEAIRELQRLRPEAGEAVH